MFRRLSLLVLLTSLAACGTPEFRAERALCAADWFERIPPDLQQRLVTLYRHVERPTGGRICTGKGRKRVCVPETRLVSIPYTAVETVDLNAPRRDAQIAACTARACTARYGNPECKPPAP
jgi:hypothetical protein